MKRTFGLFLVMGLAILAGVERAAAQGTPVAGAVL